MVQLKNRIIKTSSPGPFSQKEKGSIAAEVMVDDSYNRIFSFSG
jgi:hypothetical protein